MGYAIVSTHTVPGVKRRRDVLALTAGAGAAAFGIALPIAAAQAGDNPDAELIALCGQFDAMERQIRALYDAHTRLEDEPALMLAVAPIEADQKLLARRICSTVAVTPEGHLARVRTFLLWSGIVNPSVRAESADYLEDRFTGAMWRDLVEQT